MAATRPCQDSAADRPPAKASPRSPREHRVRAFLVAFWHRAYRENITGLSAMVAYNMLIGIIPVALLALFVPGQVLSSKLGWTGGFWAWLQRLDFGTLGYAIVGLFALTWLLAIVVWRWRGLEERWRPAALSSRPMAVWAKSPMASRAKPVVVDGRSFTDQIELGSALLKKYNVRSVKDITSCSTCHR